LGQKIKNRSFENGWSNWDHSGFDLSTSDPYHGTYHSWGYSAACFIEQNIGAVPADEIIEFSIWTKATGYIGNTIYTLIIYYTNGTNTEHDIEFGDDVWAKSNLKGYLTLGEDLSVERIRIEYQNSYFFGQFDLVSLKTSYGGSIDNGTDVAESDMILDVSLEQTSDVARRDVPTKSTGEVQDTGTYLMHLMRLTFSMRVSDSGKTDVESMFDSRIVLTVELGKWTFIGWFRDKDVIYEAEQNKPWLVTLEFDIYSYSYTP